jgi:hypothetical protein
VTPRAGSPLLVTGLPRSGTSWVGKMLEASGEVVYVNEPLNPGHPPGRSPGVLNAEVTHRFQYICGDNEESWLPAFRRTTALRYGFGAELRRNRSAYDVARLVKYGTAFTVGRLKGRRALLDDPFAVLSTAWLAERVGCDAVVLVRDPSSFVGSWQRLGWTVHFHELLEQPLLLRDHLGPYAERMRTMVGSSDWIERVSLLWEIAARVVTTAAATSNRIRLVRYEDMAMEPMRAFPALYEGLGLTWSPVAQAAVAAATSSGDPSGSPHSWRLRGGLSRTALRPMDSRTAVTEFGRRLSAKDSERVRELTADAAGALAPWLWSPARSR